MSGRGERGTLKCAIPAGPDLAFFRIGERAKLPVGLDLSKFALGAQVKLHCQKLGDFRLKYLKSETAVVEVKE